MRPSACPPLQLLEKLVSLARAPTPEKAASLSSLIRDVVARQQAEALELERNNLHLDQSQGNGGQSFLHSSSAVGIGQDVPGDEDDLDVE